MSTRTLRLVAVMMIATMLNLSLYQTAAAAVIDTGDAMRTVAHADRLSDVQAVLARADVQPCSSATASASKTRCSVLPLSAKRSSPPCSRISNSSLPAASGYSRCWALPFWCT